jgi:phage FluMu gp28-like protein
MSSLIPYSKIDSDAKLSKHFMPHQLHWIQGEDAIHAQHKQAYALGEKSVRIGWTYADAFKNVRKRLRFNKRNYLFATKDWPSALEYMNQVYQFAEFFNLTASIVSHGEQDLKVPRLDPAGGSTPFTDEIKIGTIKFDNGSRIIAFSAHPQAMAVHGGDVGLDEFAKHPNARLLWQTAQGRITWGFDIALWSSHDGEDTLFNQFAQQARSACSEGINAGTSERRLAPFCFQRPEFTPDPCDCEPIESQKSKIKNPNCPWNLYYRVTMPDAIDLGLVDIINRSQGTCFSSAQFLADCQARAGADEIYQQSYLCNPCGASAAAIVDWSAIERCRADYSIERLHLESNEIIQLFGQPGPGFARESQIQDFLRDQFPNLFASPRRRGASSSTIHHPSSSFRLGFDVAASGHGDLAAFYIDQVKGSELWLRSLLTARTEDWHFLKTTLFYFLQRLPNLQAAGDESGLGRQICWEAASQFSSRFTQVNFTSKKHDLGFALMNQLSVAEKRFPRSDYDIAADFFALRKVFSGTKWIFTESHNSSNPASHCDIAWAAALATHAHANRRPSIGAIVVYATEEEQNGAPNRGYYGCEPPPLKPVPRPDPNQEYPLACGVCAHRPISFNPLPPRCQKCRFHVLHK